MDMYYDTDLIVKCVDLIAVSVILVVIVWVNCLTISSYYYFSGKDLSSVNATELAFDALMGSLTYTFIFGLLLGVWDLKIPF